MKDCKFCDKNGLLILVLRYAAVTGDGAGKELSALPSTLGDKVSDLALAHGVYAPRLLRQGYLYVLVKRSGVFYWEAYAANEDAYLYKFPIDFPPSAPVPFTCDGSTCGVDASMIAIDKVEFVEKIYLLFTPSPMTAAKLDEYKANPEGMVKKGRMQTFDPKGWVRGSTEQAHAMKAEQLSTHVPEFMLYKQCDEAHKTALGKSLKSHLFPATSGAYAGLPASKPDTAPQGRLGALEFKMKKVKAAAFVVFDHIGITQELNDFRNAAIDPVRPWLQEIDIHSGVSNERKMHVLGSVDDVRDAFLTGMVTGRQQTIERHRQSSDASFRRRINQAKLLRLQGRIADAEAVENDVEGARKFREVNYRKAVEEARADGPEAWIKYTKRLPGMEPFRKEFQRITASHDAVLQTRVDDHLRWLQSAQLLAALDAYDRTDPASGQAFQDQIGLAMLGMNYTEQAMQLVIRWMEQQSITDANLLLRAYCLNQENVMRELEQSMVAARQTASRAANEASNWWKSLDLIQGQMKGAIDAFANADAALESLPAQHAYSGQLAGMGTVIYTTMGQALFRQLSTWRIKGLDRWYIGAFSASLGRLNANVRLSELAHANTNVQQLPDAERVQGQATRRVREALATEFSRGATGDLYKMRVCSMLALIEGIGLIVRAKENGPIEKWGTRQLLEVTGAGVAIAAAGFEMLAVSAEYVQRHHRSVAMSSRGAGVALGGIKLFAGALVGFAGAVGAVYDFVDAEKAKERRRFDLMYALRARGIAQGTIGILGSVIAYSYCGPLFEYLARKVPNQFAANALQGLVRGAYWLSRPAAGAMVARMAILVRVAACVSWVSIGITVLLFVLSDDALEDWCDQSSFRKNPKPSDRSYVGEGKEQEELYMAFSEVR